MGMRSKRVVGGINSVAVLLSIAIVSAGVWLSTKVDNACVNLVQWPVIVLGVVVLAVSVAGLVGASRGVQWLLLLYLVAMPVLLLLLACLVAFVFAVTVRGNGHLAPGRLYLEYRLEDYSIWMREKVRSSHRWSRIRTCLTSAAICAGFNRSYTNAQDLFTAHITPLQSGCCKPPTACGYTYVSPTVWISPINPRADEDCGLWSNDPARLCYSCDSCKAGLLANLKREWRRADVVLLVALLLLLLLYLMACMAFRSAKTQDLFRRYKQGYT